MFFYFKRNWWNTLKIFKRKTKFIFEVKFSHLENFKFDWKYTGLVTVAIGVCKNNNNKKVVIAAFGRSRPQNTKKKLRLSKSCRDPISCKIRKKHRMVKAMAPQRTRERTDRRILIDTRVN